MEYTCAAYISVSLTHLDYTCGDPAYFLLTAVWINPQYKGTEMFDFCEYWGRGLNFLINIIAKEENKYIL